MLQRTKFKRLKNLIASTLCLALAAAGALFAQSDQAIFRTDTRLVVLHATVVDKSGHLITTLPQTAFQVYENGVQQQVKLFKREDVPVSMGLIVDNSGSMRDKRTKVAAAAVALVKASNKDDEAFVVNFNDDAYLDCDFTNATAAAATFVRLSRMLPLLSIISPIDTGTSSRLKSFTCCCTPFS